MTIYNTQEMTTNEHPRFSVVLAVSDNSQELEQHLPAFLEQDYEPGYEVVVVDESSTDDTDDVLTRFKNQFAHLYTTFLPKPRLNITRQRLALTIGVKAAKYEWIIFANINTYPPSSDWLKELAGFAEDTNTTMMLGYVHPKNGEMRLQQFSNIEQAQTIIKKAERKRSNGHKGRWLRYMRGKYDFLAVRTSEAHLALRFYEQDIRGIQLLSLRFKTMFHNIFH